MKSGLRLLFILLLSLGIFTGVLTFTPLSWWLALPLSFLGFIVLLFIIPRKKEEVYLSSGVSQIELNRILNDGRKTVQSLKKLAYSVSDAEMSAKIRDIADIVQKIYDQFKKEPSDISRAKEFLEYYLVQGVKIIENYVYLSKQPLSDEMKTKLEEAKATVYVIESGFRQVHEKTLKDNFDELEIKGKTLESVMKVEMPDFAKVMENQKQSSEEKEE
jgi:5-bromo-4-chloroindolyl phosphate hydrolysis protein